MIDPPINLDEANEIIEEEKTCQRNEGRYNKDRGVAIRLQYLESIVNELVAAREKIAELEAKAETWRCTAMMSLEGNARIVQDEFEMKCQYQEGEIVGQKRQIDDLKAKLLQAIIPQADDAQKLRLIFKILECGDEICEDITEEEELLKRYLAAIEGGKP